MLLSINTNDMPAIGNGGYGEIGVDKGWDVFRIVYSWCEVRLSKLRSDAHEMFEGAHNNDEAAGDDQCKFERRKQGFNAE